MDGNQKKNNGRVSDLKKDVRIHVHPTSEIVFCLGRGIVLQCNEIPLDKYLEKEEKYVFD